MGPAARVPNLSLLVNIFTSLCFRRFFRFVQGGSHGVGGFFQPIGRHGGGGDHHYIFAAFLFYNILGKPRLLNRGAVR